MLLKVFSSTSIKSVLNKKGNGNIDDLIFIIE